MILFRFLNWEIILEDQFWTFYAKFISRFIARSNKHPATIYLVKVTIETLEKGV